MSTDRKEEKGSRNENAREQGEESTLIGTKELGIDDAYALAGGCDRYQYRVAFCSIVSYTVSVISAFVLPLLLSFPIVTGCGDKSGVCPSTRAACMAKSYSYQDLKANLISEYDLLCTGYKATLLLGSFSLGWCIGGVVSLNLADLEGRLLVMKMGHMCVVATLPLLLIFSHFYGLLVVMGLLGMSAMAVGPASFALAFDSVESKYIRVSATYLNVSAAIIQLACAGLLMLGMYWRYLYLALPVLALLLICLLLWLPESPKFLASKGLRQAATQSLEYIAQTNSRLMPKGAVVREEPFDFMRLKSCREVAKVLTGETLRWRLLWCFLSFLGVGYLHTEFTSQSKGSQSSPYLPAIINAAVALLSYLFSNITASKLGTKFTLVVSALAICALIFAQEFTTLC